MAHTAKEQMLALVEEGFRKAAWHGPNLCGALRGVSVQEASWRPARGRHNIWEIAMHAAYWKYAVTKRLVGSKKHEFSEKGRNWFERGLEKHSTADARQRWTHDSALLSQMHKALLAAIAALGESEFDRPCRGSRQTVRRNVVGIAMHDVYHAGQIQLLRRLYEQRRG